MAQEKIHRQQKERELEANKDMVDRQGQEVDLLKALLAKLQKYERDMDQKHGSSSHPKRKEVFLSQFCASFFRTTFAYNFSKIKSRLSHFQSKWHLENELGRIK